jgi:two-component system, LytTR family, sensor histidine kinase AlgZ
MHPILASRARTALYVASWIPIAALLETIVTRSGQMPPLEAVLIVFPMCIMYAFVCQASWYVCQALPLRESEIFRLLSTHATAAVVSSLAWVGAGYLWAFLVGASFEFEGIVDHYVLQLPILFFSGVLLFLLAIAFNYLLITFEVGQRAEQKALEMQILAREAELKALRAQIDPHFLFNSLNSINALIMSDPVAARRMCVLLADFLRGSLKLGSEDRISFGEEIELAEHYLNIEKVRLGSRLIVETHVDEPCRNCGVPPLILQPLVENAITHGIAPMLEGGTVRIEAKHQGSLLKVVVENPFETERETKNGAGLGIKNVRMRLANLFNGDARLNVDESGGRFRIELHLPCDES